MCVNKRRFAAGGVAAACLLGVSQTRSTTAEATPLCNFTCVAPNLDRVATQCGLGLGAGVQPNAIPTRYSESPSTNSEPAIVGGVLSLHFLSKCDQNNVLDSCTGIRNWI